MGESRIFVSHSHKDDKFGVRLVSDLRTRLGEDAVWYDSSGGLHGGDEWWNRIVAEITSRQFFIVIFSPDAVDSQWVVDEVNIAWTLRHRIGTRIIPVLYRPCDLRADWLLLQSVSFVEPRPYDSALSELLQVLDVPLDQVAHPAAVPLTSRSPLTLLVERLAQDIHAAFGQEDWTTVISKVKLLLIEAPDAMSPALWRELGLTYVALGDGAAALPPLDEAFKTDQFDVSTLRGKGLAYHLLGKPDDAVALLDRAYALAPFTDVSLRLTLLGELYTVLAGAQRWNDALQRVREALRLAPGDSDWLDRQLDLLGRGGHADEALRLARTLVRTHPPVVQQWVSKRLARDRDAGDWADALDVIELGLTAVPNDEGLLAAKLEVLTQTGKENEALTNAGMLASRHKDLADGWLRTRLLIHRDAREWLRVLAVADVAIGANLTDAMWLNNKVEALMEAKRTREAFDLARQVVAQYGTEPQAWLNLAAAAAAVGNEGEVRRAVTSSAQLEGENNPDVKQARTQYLAPFERAAAQKVEEAKRAEETVQRKARRRRMSIIGVAVSLIVVACIVLATIAHNIQQAQQAAAQQTAVAKTAVVQTAVAATASPFTSEITCVQSADITGACAQYYGKPYTAAAPGSCDRGTAKWSLDTTNSLKATCTSAGMQLSKAKSNYVGFVNFHPTSAGFPANYLITVTISNLSSGSCAGVFANGQSQSNGGFGSLVCDDGYWAIVRYDDAGSPHTVLSGTGSRASTYYLKAAVVADAHIISWSTPAGGAPINKVYYDLDYPATDYVALVLTTDTGEAESAVLSDFTYTPLT